MGGADAGAGAGAQRRSGHVSLAGLRPSPNGPCLILIKAREKGLILALRYSGLQRNTGWGRDIGREGGRERERERERGLQKRAVPHLSSTTSFSAQQAGR